MLIPSVSARTGRDRGCVGGAAGLSTFGYEQILADDRTWNGYRNTIVHTVVGTALNLVVTLSAAYSLSCRELSEEAVDVRPRLHDGARATVRDREDVPADRTAACAPLRRATIRLPAGLLRGAPGPTPDV